MTKAPEFQSLDMQLFSVESSKMPKAICIVFSVVDCTVVNIFINPEFKVLFIIISSKTKSLSFVKFLVWYRVEPKVSALTFSSVRCVEMQFRI